MLNVYTKAQISYRNINSETMYYKNFYKTCFLDTGIWYLIRLLGCDFKSQWKSEWIILRLTQGFSNSFSHSPLKDWLTIYNLSYRNNLLTSLNADWAHQPPVNLTPTPPVGPPDVKDVVFSVYTFLLGVPHFDHHWFNSNHIRYTMHLNTLEYCI